MWPFSRRRRESKSASVQTVSLHDLASVVAGDTVSERTSLQVSAVLCAVRVIAEGLAQMPFEVRRREAVGRRERVPLARDHFAWSLLMERPNDWQTPFEFVEFAAMSAALTKGFLALKVRDGAGRIREMLPVVPDSWSVNRQTDWSLIYDLTFDTGEHYRVGADEVLHIRGPSWDTINGMRPVMLAAQALGLTRALEGQQATLARSGGRPSGVLSLKQPLPQDAKDKLRTAWRDRFGPGGEGGIAVLDLDAEFRAMSVSAVDAQAIETRKFQIEEIARIFRVYPQMLMQTDKASTFASAEQFFRAHVIHTLGPWMRRFEQAVNRQVIGADFPSVFADFNERELLRGDFKDQAEFYAKALGSGGHPAWMSVNDVREDVGLDPSDDPTAERLPGRLGEQPQGGADAGA